MRLQGKVAIVTGATSGIGRATTELFAAEGASVVAADIDERGCDLNGERVHFQRADVTRSADVEALVKTAESRFGGLDVIFNNAGIAIFKSVQDTTEEEWDKVVNVNLRAVFLGIRHAVPAMRRRGGGSIISTASVHGFATAGEMGAYGATKHAVIGLTKGAALDLAQFNIRVNCICPGAIDTPLMRSNLTASTTLEEGLKSIVKSEPIGRVGQPEEIARAALFLASDESSFATGAPFIIDGGMLARLP